jgi:hypothetical protein
MDPSALGGNARSIASDPTTGIAILMGGLEHLQVGRRSIYKPLLWRRIVSGWERIPLPALGTTPNGWVEEVSPGGVAVGLSDNRAVVWEPNGLGGWSILALPGSATRATGVNSAGTLAVGDGSVYWQRQPGGWVAVPLPYGCTVAIDVDDLGRILAKVCPRPANGGWRNSSAVLVPPFTGTPMWLGGAGPGASTNGETMSLTGGWIVGQSNGVGAYWHVF